MADKTPKQHLAHIAEAMKAIDFVMFNTHTKDGQIGARPMSNNRDVDYDGDSYYFTWGDSLMAKDIEKNSKVGLSLQGQPGKEGAPGIFISIEGSCEIVRDKDAFAEHWVDELDHWFEDGIDTDGLVMLHVHATRAAYWDGEDEGDFDIG